MVQNNSIVTLFNVIVSEYSVATRPTIPALCVKKEKIFDKRKTCKFEPKDLEKLKIFNYNEGNINMEKITYITPPAKYSKHSIYVTLIIDSFARMYNIALLIWIPFLGNYKKKISLIKNIFPLFLFFMFFFQNHPT